MRTDDDSPQPQQAFGLVFDSESQTSTAGIPEAGSRPSWTREAAVDWSQETRGTPNFGQIGRCLKPLVDSLGWGKVRPAWQRYLRDTEPKFLSPAAFARNPKQWLYTAPKTTYVMPTPDVTPRQPIDVARLRALAES